MDHTRETFADALSSGDTEHVNLAIDNIDNIENTEIEKRAALFDGCFEICCDLYEASDGYQRQSLIFA